MDSCGANPPTCANGNSINIATDGSFNAGLDPLDDGRVSVDGSFGLGAVVPGLLGKMAFGQDLGINLRDGGYPSDPVFYPGHFLTVIAGKGGGPQISGTATASDLLGVTNGTAKNTPSDQPPAGGGGGGGGGSADKTPPMSIALTVPARPSSGIYLTQPLVVILAADDPGGSGILAVHYRLDGLPDTLFNGPPGSTIAIPPGTHTLCYHAVDKANNVETETCTPLVVDDAAPTVSVSPLPNANPSGWFTTSPTVTISATDLNSDGSPGSGVAGIFTSLDGAVPFTQTAGPQAITLPVGIHQLRVYATDVAGHQSQPQFLTYQVDVGPPVSSIRTFTATPAQNGWWRSNPTVYLRSVDGDQSSGVQTLQYRLDGVGLYQRYAGPFTVPSGVHSVGFQGIDVAGNTEPVWTMTIPVDITPPTATALSPSPLVFLPLLGPARLNWQAGDDLSGMVRVQVFVYTATGDVARHLDAGTVTVTPGTVINGSTNWDGRDDSLTGILPVGLYTYRVLVIDQAGNTAQSADSIPIQIKTLL
jgi:hypothetical protein